MGYAGTTLAPTPFMRELVALYYGLKVAVHNNFQPLKINVDALEVINTLHNVSNTDPPLVHDCRFLIRQLHNPKITHIYREQNMVADRLAHFGSDLTGSNITFFEQTPLF